MAGISLDALLNLVYLMSFAVFFAYGQRIQMYTLLLNVRRKLGRLESYKNLAHRRLLELVLENKNSVAAETTLARLWESFVIGPVSLHPAGIVGKLEHVLDTYDDHLKREMQNLLVGASETKVQNLTNLLEVSINLDSMFRVVRHYYIQSKKQGGLLPLTQLQMSLPTIVEEAEAYNSAVEAFAAGKAIGDAVGPLVAKEFSEAGKAREVVKDTDLYESSLEGRGTAISEIRDLLVESELAQKQEYVDLRNETRDRYRKVLPSLADLSARVTKTLQAFVPASKVDFSWQEMEGVDLPTPRVGTMLLEDGHISAVGKTGHGLQRAFIVAMLQ